MSQPMPNALCVFACLLLATMTGVPANAASQESDPVVASSTMTGVQPGPTPSDPLREMWRFNDPGYKSLQPPLVTDEVAITVGETDDHRYIIALDNDTGDLIWQQRMSEETLDSFAIAGDLLFVRTDDGYIQALAVDDGKLRWTSTVTIDDFPQTIVTDGDRIYTIDDDRAVAVETSSGELIWEARPFPGSQIDVVALTNSTLFVVSNTKGDGVVALDVAIGDESWRYERTGGSLYVSGVTNDRVFVANYKDESRGQGWIALDMNSGAPLWEVPTTGVVLDEAVTADTLYACTNDSLAAFAILSGSPVWSQVGECSGLTVTDEAVTFASGGKDGHAITSLALDGAPRWSIDIAGPFDEVGRHTIKDEVIYVGTYSQAYRAELIALSGDSPEAASSESSSGSVVETVPIPECSDFTSYGEVQRYYAEHPEAQSVLDQDMDGLACEVYFAEEPVADMSEPPMADLPPDAGSGGDAGDGNEPVYTEDPVAPSVPGSPPNDGNAGNSDSGSRPVYTDFGGLDGVDYDCYDFASQGDAQAYFESDGGSSYNNADGLDRNHNGLACEDGEFD